MAAKQATRDRKIDWSKLHPWLKAAEDFGEQNQGYFTIEPGTEEYKSWARYFQKLDWAPWAFRRIAETKRDGGTVAWTAPCQWPDWLTIDIEAMRPAIEQWRMRVGR